MVIMKVHILEIPSLMSRLLAKSLGEDANRDKTINQNRVSLLTEEKLKLPPPKCDDDNSESAKRRITRKIEKISALDVALYLYEYRTFKEDLHLFADVKRIFSKTLNNSQSVTATRRDGSCVASFRTHPVPTP